ncbi:TetR family transcriptional regulator [Alkalihalobacterium sp. APHAB7]|uniref:TetR family transcriptional regulator n=1 Tax=Alkalihalobacterium sp. APHAB7 TaxID=3402081 RepID=UPI003AAFDE8D
MGLREMKTAKKKEDIIRSAAKIVSRKGYHGATMEDIAAELLMTKGALYYYFDNKDDLVYHCHDLILSSAIKTLEDYLRSDVSSIEKFKKAVEVHVEFAITEKETFNMIIKPQQTFTEKRLTPILEKRQKYANIFDEIIQQGIDSGEFKITEVKMARMMILGALNWIQQWYLPEGKKSKKEIVDIYSDYLLKLLK